MTAPELSAACRGWARTAGFAATVGDGSVILEPFSLDRETLRVRWSSGGRVVLTECDADGVGERELLFAADVDVVERYLIGLLVL